MLVLLACKPWSNEEVIIRMVVAAAAAAVEMERNNSPQLVHSFRSRTYITVGAHHHHVHVTTAVAFVVSLFYLKVALLCEIE
jgi:anthranilate phosphoribosyltransferase